MASGLPIITTNIEANQELIEHEESGLLVPTQNAQAIAEAILRYGHQKEFAETCGQNAQKKARQDYDIQRMLNQLWDLYINLLYDFSHLK